MSTDIISILYHVVKFQPKKLIIVETFQGKEPFFLSRDSLNLCP